MPDTRSPTGRPGFFEQNPRLLLAGMAVLFLMAGAVRLYRLNAPGGIAPSRDYMSAILARSLYFEHTDSVDAWRKEVAYATRRNQPVLEPPVTEFLVSLLYRAVDGEHLWLARLLTCSFWLIGAVFVFKIAERVVSTEAAVSATAYYLFLPMSILLSRSFQPESLMMLLFLISLFSAIRYYEEPSDSRLVTAACLSGLTLLCRPLVLFPLFGAFTALALSQEGGCRRLIDRRFLIYIAVSLFPPVLYYGYGILGAGYLRWNVEASFRLSLLLHREFWVGWLQLAGHGVGYTAIIGALLGASMLHKGLPRTLVIGLGVGYVVFGLVFTLHIHTHAYYHAMLIPIVAISFGPLVTLIANRLRQASDGWYWRLAIVGTLGLAVSFSFLEVREWLGSQLFEGVETAQEIGKIVNHSSQVVWLAGAYGVQLQYNGELTGAYWPRKISYWLYRGADERELSIDERLDALGFSPEYFVITAFDEFSEHHADLKEFLADNCVLVAENTRYLVYGTCTER